MKRPVTRRIVLAVALALVAFVLGVFAHPSVRACPFGCIILASAIHPESRITIEADIGGEFLPLWQGAPVAHATVVI